MSDKSAIEWTESTWNPVRGCTKVSPGCAHCYAETFAERWRGVKGHAYEQGFDLRLVPEKLDEPLRRKKPTTYFVNSMSDLFQEGVPDAFIDRVFAVMALSPWNTYQILTKRAERMRAYMTMLTFERMRRWMNLDVDGNDGRVPTPAGGFQQWPVTFLATHARRRREQIYADRPELWAANIDKPPLPNVWLGVSVENQHFADERIPLLLQTPAAVRFISAEPLLGSIGIAHWLRLRQRNDLGGAVAPGARLDWVIVGGESGHGARPFDLAWARSIVAQCKAAGVPVFVKQLGAHVRGDVKGCLLDWREMPDGEMRRLPIIGTPSANRWITETRENTIGGRLYDSKGGDPAEWPEDLRIRQFPAVRP